MAATDDFIGYPPLTLSPERKERNVRRSQLGSPNKPVRTGGQDQQTPLDANGKTDPLTTPSQGATILTGNPFLTQQRPANPQQPFQAVAETEEKSQDLPPAMPAEKPGTPPEEGKEDSMEQEEES